MNSMYVEVGELLDLIECIEKRNNHPKVKETIEEVVNVIHDMKWIEIKEETA